MTPIRYLMDHVDEKFKCINKTGVTPALCVCEDIGIPLSDSFTLKVNITSNEIFLSETFLNYLWAFTFFSFVYQEKSNEYLLGNPTAICLPMDSELLKQALRLKSFCKDIVYHGFTAWPKDTIFPHFHGEPSDEIEYFEVRTNGLFSTAIAFLLMHEVGHIVLKHMPICDKKTDIEKKIKYEAYKPSDGDLEPIISAESDADNFAFDVLLKLTDSDDIKLNNSYGVASACVASLFCIKTLWGVKSKFHQASHNRLLHSIQKINLLGVKEKKYFAHYASQSLMLFLDQNGKYLTNYDAGQDEYGFLLDTMDQVDNAIGHFA
ncbi:hypothetical protein AGMMS4952_09570 [Spirochaetia bacterium]|nr:hypothetical protein AGMMS4952_09570 [Spirochaetia bacterium]